MRPSFRPSLVNGRFGDPALYVEALHQRGAILFDMGDLSGLSPPRSASHWPRLRLAHIEARFVAEDAARARDRAHLTTHAAGEFARAARVRTVEPFHFSPRYEGEEERMLTEVAAAFQR